MLDVESIFVKELTKKKISESKNQSECTKLEVLALIHIALL